MIKKILCLTLALLMLLATVSCGGADDPVVDTTDTISDTETIPPAMPITLESAALAVRTLLRAYEAAKKH